jgi:uncharacterized protein YkwD
MKDRIVKVLGEVSTYFNKTIKDPVVELVKKEETLPSKIDIPGALRVVSNVLNINNIQLTKDKVIELTNEARKENGNLNALVENKKLDSSAEKKLQDMFTNQYFEHISPSGKSVGDLSEESGYDYILIGENLAMGNFKDDASLLAAWMASEGHRENILNTNYIDIGVAVGKGKFEGKDVWMAVQHFGVPQSSCLFIDKVLYMKIIINQNKLKEMEDDLVTRRDMINEGVIYEGSTHYEQIDIYNSLIKPYNNLITTTKTEIETYNNGVEAYNNCLRSKQQ